MMEGPPGRGGQRSQRHQNYQEERPLKPAAEQQMSNSFSVSEEESQIKSQSRIESRERQLPV